MQINYRVHILETVNMGWLDFEHILYRVLVGWVIPYSVATFRAKNCITESFETSTKLVS